MARYQRHLDQEIAEDMWSQVVGELPKGLQPLFDQPAEKHKDTSDLSLHSLEKEVRLDGNEVSLFLQVSYTVEDDSDGESIYGADTKRMSFWFTANPWAEESEAKIGGYGDLDLRGYKRLMHTWVGKIKDLYPEVAARYNLR